MTADFSSLDAIARIDIPGPYKFLFEPARFISLRGGRNSAKDWSVVRADLVLGMLYNPEYSEADIKSVVKSFGEEFKIKTGLIEKSMRGPHRILYCREVMESIKRSVHTTIKDQIGMLGLRSFWTVKDDSVVGVNGTEITYAGLFRDPHNIKSKEGVSLCRCVEAENISEESWKSLVPTIRAPGSQILVSWNPRYEDDPTHQRWAVNPPAGTVVKMINSTDIEGFYDADGNERYLSAEAKMNRENDYKLRRWEYDNVWLGQCLNAGRKIYPMFDEHIHVRSFDKKMLKEKANFYMASDPAQKYYPACVWIAEFPDEMGTMIRYIYSEYPKFDTFSDYFCKVRNTHIYNGSIAEMANNFFLHGGVLEHGYRIRAYFIDTRFAKGTGGLSVFSNSTDGIVGEYLKKENGGIGFECPDVNIIDAQRANVIKDLECNPVAEIGPYNHPNLYVDPTCLNVIQTLKNHRLEDKSEAEASKYKDFSDAIRIGYAGMTRYKYIAPKYLDEPKVQYISQAFRGDSPDAWMAM